MPRNPRDPGRVATRHRPQILHPAYAFRPGWQYDFNVFAMALALADERHTIRRVFRMLDGAYTVRPWRYLSEPEKEFTRHHRRA